MIDVRELRIGSHFHIGGVWRRVTGMNGHTGRLVGRMLDKDGKVCDDVYRAEDIEPIPITEELLAELGFLMTEKHGSVSVWMIRNIRIDFYGKQITAMVGNDYNKCTIYPICYLHELETFLYQTTKKELIKE